MRLSTSNWLDGLCIQLSLRTVLELRLRGLRLSVASSEILNSKVVVFHSLQNSRRFLEREQLDSAPYLLSHKSFGQPFHGFSFLRQFQAVEFCIHAPFPDRVFHRSTHRVCGHISGLASFESCPALLEET